MPTTARLQLPGLIILSIASMLTTGVAYSATGQCIRDEVTNRQKIGLVLGGGGARGYAHVGVLKKLTA